MELLFPFHYLVAFLTSQQFQREQPWVQWIGRRCSIIHQDLWTGSRLLTPFVLILIFIYVCDQFWLNLAFILSALTDWIDGLVAWLKKANGWWGAFWDGLVDKFYSQSLLWYFGYIGQSALNHWWWLASMTLIEFGGYMLLFSIRTYRIFKEGESWKAGDWQLIQ